MFKEGLLEMILTGLILTGCNNVSKTGETTPTPTPEIIKFSKLVGDGFEISRFLRNSFLIQGLYSWWILAINQESMAKAQIFIDEKCTIIGISEISNAKRVIFVEDSQCIPELQ